MPYVFDLDAQEWPEDAGDDFEPPEPKASQFEFMPPHELSGESKGPIFFAEPKVKPAKPEAPAKPGFFARLFGKRAAPLLNYRVRTQDIEIDAGMLAALRAAGIETMRFRYDGGKDEGFAWFLSAQTADGAALDPEGLEARINLPPLPDSPEYGFAYRLEDFSQELGAVMLGQGFGTGPFYMFGEFTANLQTRELKDDPAARPFKENIEIDLDG